MEAAYTYRDYCTDQRATFLARSPLNFKYEDNDIVKKYLDFSTIKVDFVGNGSPPDIFPINIQTNNKIYSCVQATSLTLTERIHSIIIEIIATVGAFFWGMTVGVYSACKAASKMKIDTLKHGQANASFKNLKICSVFIKNTYSTLRVSSHDKYEQIKSYLENRFK